MEMIIHTWSYPNPNSKQIDKKQHDKYNSDHLVPSHARVLTLPLCPFNVLMNFNPCASKWHTVIAPL